MVRWEHSIDPEVAIGFGEIFRSPKGDFLSDETAGKLRVVEPLK